MLQACHEDITDPNLIRKCKCKNFVTGKQQVEDISESSLSYYLKGFQDKDTWTLGHYPSDIQS